MNTILDKRNSSNWPLTVQGVDKLSVNVTMAGPKGVTDVTTGSAGTGLVTDANGITYTVKLPGSAGSQLAVTFQRVQV